MLRDEITRLDGTFYSFLDLGAGGYVGGKIRTFFKLVKF
jgi:hypothetical protein